MKQATTIKKLVTILFFSLICMSSKSDLLNLKSVTYYKHMHCMMGSCPEYSTSQTPSISLLFMGSIPQSVTFYHNDCSFKLKLVQDDDNMAVYEALSQEDIDLHSYFIFSKDSEGDLKFNFVEQRIYTFNNTLFSITSYSTEKPSSDASNMEFSDSYNGGVINNSGYNNNRYIENGSRTSTSRRRTCPGCNGKGKGPDQIIYAPNYTGKDNSRYCGTCGKTTSAHSHHSPICRTCYGKGYVE